MPGPVSQSNPGAVPGGFHLACAFCDFAYHDYDNYSEELRDHILVCAKHPIAPIIKRLRQAEELLLQVEYNSEDSWGRALEGLPEFNKETLVRMKGVKP